jgi:hypothetical protein
MLVTPRPGINRNDLLASLTEAHTTVFNMRGSGAGTAYDRLLDYLDWTNHAATVLASQISSKDLDRLVLTRRYELLLSGVGTLAGTEAQRVVNGLVLQEFKERTDAFDQAIKALRESIGRWDGSQYFLVADSSFYIEHPDKFEEADLAEVLGYYDGSIHLLIPMVVVDELDRLKRSKDRHARWRSRHTLAVLDELFKSGADVARLRDADIEVQRRTGVRRGQVDVEILFDPPGHVRLPINDDEIVDRAAAVQPLTGRHITLLTYDTGQASRGRRAGLKVAKLSQPQEEGESHR